jgi:polyferredoxin
MPAVAQFHWKRRATQLAMLLLIVLAPAAGLFRIDLTTASFNILGRDIWWSDFAFTFGLGLVIATLPIITYMTIGTVWCGWACPQNLLSEWANNLTYRLLGKRASVNVDEQLHVAASKNRPFNWLLLALIFLAAALVLGVIPFLFFYPAATAWGFVTHTSTDGIARFMQWLYYFAVFLIFVDIAVVRHFFCNHICVYRIGQRIFKTTDALHIRYDASRAAACAKCNYCATECVTRIEPTNIQRFDSCINCAECIDACNRLQAKHGATGLLSFQLGEAAGTPMLRGVARHFNWLVGAFFLAGMLMMTWGVATAKVEQPYVPTAADLQLRALAEQCHTQCALPRERCKHGGRADCYQAAACQCQCQLDHDPSNSAGAAWRQCVQINQENADRLLRTEDAK